MKNSLKSILCVLLASLTLAMTACGNAKMETYDNGMAAPGYADNMKGDYNYSIEMEDSALGYVDKDYSATTEAPAESITPEGQSVPDSARKLIKNVSMDVETLTFEDFMKELYGRINAAGGYIQSSTENAGGYGSKYAYLRSAYITARIPADRLDFFVSGVEDICNVVSRRENTQDVTLTYYDTESHMRALQSEYDTLVGILEKCTKLEDVISVQRRITDVLYQIESYKTTLNNYDNLVAYSTVTFNISEVKEPTVVKEQTLGERISTGFAATMRDMREWSENFAVGFVANLPYILIWAVVILVAFFLLRRTVRRIRKKRAKAPQPPVETPENKEN